MLLWTDDVVDTHRPILEAIKKTGYGVVEIPIFHGDADKCHALARTLDDLSLARTALTARGGEDNPISPDPSIRRLAVVNSCRAVDCAVALGAKLLVGPFHSGFGVFSGSASTTDEWRWAVEGMTEVSIYARMRGVALSLEFLNRFECYLLNTTADTARFVEAINMQNVGILYDSHHANIEDPDITKTFSRYAHLVNHIHVSESHRGTLGTGQVDWFATFAAIKASGYSGDIVVEAFGQNVPALIPVVKIWRQVFDTEEALMKDSYSLIQKQLNFD